LKIFKSEKGIEGVEGSRYVSYYTYKNKHDVIGASLFKPENLRNVKKD